MGHSTTRAALIYQHRTTEWYRLIAAAMGQLVEAELDQTNSPSGTQRPRCILMAASGTLITPLTRRFVVERVTRIELALSAWEADVLPLNYTRGRTRGHWPAPRAPVARPDIVPETTAVSIAPRTEEGRWTHGTVHHTGCLGWSTG